MTRSDAFIQPVAPVSLVKFMPNTGRKHQIRLHASYAMKCALSVILSFHAPNAVS